MVRRRVVSDPRTTSNYYDYYMNSEGVEAALLYARDMLAFTVEGYCGEGPWQCQGLAMVAPPLLPAL